MASRVVLGQPSYRIATAEVEAFVTELGAQMAPVTFWLDDRNVAPYSVAPWAEEPIAASQPPILRALRGDFFCMPFGANLNPFRGEVHPLHGATANERWSVEAEDAHRVRLSLITSPRPARVTREVRLVPGHTCVYQVNRVDGLEGPMTFGMHAMLKCTTPGRVSVGPFRYGQVYPGEFERAQSYGYQALEPGARFERLAEVPLRGGGTADLSRYPSRLGYEDLVQVFSSDQSRLGWSAVTFPDDGYAWFTLRDASVLTGTILWHSNGGRHYAPWSGRHTAVLGIEDVCSYFHDGLAQSWARQETGESPVRVCRDVRGDEPLEVRTISGVVSIPAGFEMVSDLRMESGHLVISDSDGRTAKTPADTSFL